MKQDIGNNNNHLKITVLKLVHFGITLALFYVFWLLFRYHRLNVARTGRFRYNYFILGAYAAILFFFIRTYNAYLLGYTRIRTMVFAQIISQIFSVLIIFVSVSIGWQKVRSPLVFLILLPLQLLVDIVWSWFGNKYFFRINPTRKTILIYRNELDKRRFGTVKGKPSERLYRITEEFRYNGNSFDEIRDRLNGFDAIFVAGVNSACRNGIVKYCKEEDIPGFFLPHVGDVIMQEAQHIQSFDSPVLFVQRSYLRPEYAFVKRAFDIFASFCGIVVLSPLMLITALAVKLYDGGPAIYKQVRLTKNGREFNIYKFRSMRVDAEKDGVARLSSGDRDDRITPVGRIVRKCRLDELPQLFNILKGDMSVVGPRPERPEIAEEYYRKMPAFRLRLQVKAGLTGYAQVYGKYNTDPYEKLEFDLLYINHMGVLTDLQLMFATFAILFLPESTEGIEEGRTAALDEEELEK
ncbi:MAG: exopolysaccharide biosynthesis polyprenyl glycosylphosphotransferase [Lachnospiraceae bacterium]|nr:exopolysaccharide biosynthesis polyprenyl glycosylphosphotransferase [Lachnospiraceae bacterium]